MDSCFADIIIEFWSVAFHNILYHASVYPKSIFEIRKKYSVVVYRSMHPEVNQYIDLCLKNIAECLKNGQLHRVEFIITDSSYTFLAKVVFDINKTDTDGSSDAYLLEAEQNLRALCLNLSSISRKFKDFPEDCSFTIHIHTNESTAVAMAINPELEEFPLVEVEGGTVEMTKILPLRRFCIRSHSLDAYVEIR